MTLGNYTLYSKQLLSHYNIIIIIIFILVTVILSNTLRNYIV